MRMIIAMCALLISAAPAAADDPAAARVRAAILAVAPDATVGAVRPSPMAGVYEATVGNSNVYVSADGKYLFSGAMWDVGAKRNLSEQRQAELRRAALAGIDRSQRIAYPATTARGTVTVFTDLDCGYCRKLHEHMQAFNAAGISVEYLMLPRGGLDSPSFDAAVSVWCAADRPAALTLAKQGQMPAHKVCPNPIREHFLLGARLGVASTPTVIAPDGSVIGGYLTPAQMVSALRLPAASAQ